MRTSPAFERRLAAAALASLAAWGVAHRVAPPERLAWTPGMRDAAARVQEAIPIVRAARERAGLPIDPAADPNATGLIGSEWGALSTTLGAPEAKRTTTQPDVAALLVHLLREAGVEQGDTVAVGASGSFPGLLVATLAAVEAMDAHPRTILSLGASSFGATDPAFDLLALHLLLFERGWTRSPPAAASLGGARDRGEDLEPEVRTRLEERIGDSGIPLVLEPDLRASVTRRMEIYGSAAAFVNLGGADANVGISPTLLALRPGLLEEVALPPPELRGVLQEMAARGTPVVHLLDVRTLALRHGLRWDPVPLPPPGATALLRGGGGPGRALVLVAAAWLLSVVLLFSLPVMIPGVVTTPDPPEGTGR